MLLNQLNLKSGEKSKNINFYLNTWKYDADDAYYYFEFNKYYKPSGYNKYHYFLFIIIIICTVIFGIVI